MNTNFAFETETGIPVSTARKRTEKYAEDGTEPVGRFMAKSALANRALPGLGKGGA